MKNSKGQSLIEVIAGLAVMMIVILSLVTVTTVSVRNASFSRNQMLATKYAQEWIEEARNLRETQTKEVFFTGSSCDIAHQPILQTVFSRERTCSLSPDGETIEVIVTVSWSDAQGTHESKLTTELTNWK